MQNLDVRRPGAPINLLPRVTALKVTPPHVTRHRLCQHGHHIGPSALSQAFRDGNHHPTDALQPPHTGASPDELETSHHPKTPLHSAPRRPSGGAPTTCPDSAATRAVG